jgi:hypothetical protein
MSCEHAYQGLEIAPTVTSRGVRPVVRITCGTCGRIFTGDSGIARIVIGLRDDLGALIEVVSALGGSFDQPPAMLAQDDNTECQHFLGWLEINPGDRSPTRGHTPLSSFKCVNCNKTWPDCSTLLVVLKKEIEKIWMAVRKLEARP